MNTLGATLRSRRLELGLMLNDIATRLQTTAVYVSDIERGKRIPASDRVLIGLAAAYELSFEEIQDLAWMARDAIELDTTGATEHKRQFAARLARSWPDLSEERIEKLNRYLEEEE